MNEEEKEEEGEGEKKEYTVHVTPWEEAMNERSEQAVEANPAKDRAAEEKTVRLALHVTEPDLVAELLAHPVGEARNRFALTALRIGVLALKQAEGRLDADTIRNESDRLLTALGHALESHEKTVTGDMAVSLERYFDPKSGRFTERIERLVAKDGDLERFMRGQVGPENSALAKTLAEHLGERSPMMKLLSPEDSEGFLSVLRKMVDGALAGQREAILAQFSLDEEDSALSRLVRRIDATRGEITGEFSLDNENSALARMKRELAQVLADHKKEADAFRSEVTEKLGVMAGRRDEAKRSPRHGDDFEADLRRFVTDECQKASEVMEDTSNTPGLIKACKKGDLVVQLGPEAHAAGARIVIEAKEDKAYTLKKALEESAVGRRNRGAEVGIFVYSAATAPENLEPLRRYGFDIVVVWDRTDPSSDVYLLAALTIARALCSRAASDRGKTKLDFEKAEKAIRAVEKLTSGLDEIERSGKTIKSGAETILKRADIMRREIERKVEVLDKELTAFKAALPDIKRGQS
ncbi:MAG: hypothetical protein ACYTFG_13730 [Planctomycetota bacterium]